MAICVVGIIASSVAFGLRTYHQNRFLKEIFGATFSDLEIVSADRISFTDASRAWHVRFKRNAASLPTSATPSDASDLAFAIRQIESLLGESLCGLVSPSVHRMGACGRDAYLVRDGQSKDVYIYVFVN